MLRFQDRLFSYYFLGAIYIPRHEIGEEISFNTFFGPFSKQMWIALLIFILILTLLKSILMYFLFYKIDILDLFEASWSSLAAYFGGGGILESKLYEKLSYKIILFTSLLCGNIVWMGYQGFLFAELGNH